ncbi:MAG: undecaprenyldiphospho-muramoylpentapeptide beta-N-acetylglucosaminyltransferase [Myxococcota bacterium]|nr:undecaprenyldiphospho-muramoylpentapeptide beta-N-acetylglucosaminyltransferase [Myxococcota bacterium]
MRLMIAGGGTGGHLFPGVAIAEELRARAANAEVRFVGTRRGIEARVLPELGWSLDLIEVSGLKTVGAIGALRGLVRLPRALWQARRAIEAFAPDAVIGVGGYASGPVVLMARLAGIPTAICEQNSIPGLTNKLLGRVARTIFLSFEESRRFFKPTKIVMSGNPVRRDLLQKLLAAPPARADTADATVEVLVCGGSQGAVAVNELAAQALITLAGERPVGIVHQTGERDLAATAQRYATAGVAAECRAFIKDMAAAYQRADIIIGRAGATTVAELAIAGKPAVFIPYPFAADNHQELNARAAGSQAAYRWAAAGARTRCELGAQAVQRPTIPRSGCAAAAPPVSSVRGGDPEVERAKVAPLRARGQRQVAAGEAAMDPRGAHPDRRRDGVLRERTGGDLVAAGDIIERRLEPRREPGGQAAHDPVRRGDREPQAIAVWHRIVTVRECDGHAR